MKPVFENISLKEQNKSLKIFSIKERGFRNFWHFHPQMELTYIIEGEGMRYVGDSIETFGAGDLVLLGKNLPHNWASFENSENAHAMVIQFSENILSHYSEFSFFEDLFTNAKGGLLFETPDNKLIDLIKGLEECDIALKLIKFFEILYFLKNQSSRTLSGEGFNVQKLNKRETRINKIKIHLNNRISQPVSLSEVAGYMQMTESYFCRWFKKNTGKTLVNYINKLRIEMVCRELRLTDKNIAEIAYENGFENISHFNRVFKNLKEVSPRQYRKISS